MLRNTVIKYDRYTITNLDGKNAPVVSFPRPLNDYPPEINRAELTYCGEFNDTHTAFHLGTSGNKLLKLVPVFCTYKYTLLYLYNFPSIVFFIVQYYNVNLGAQMLAYTLHIQDNHKQIVFV